MWGYDVDIEVTDWRNNKAPLCLHFVWTIDLKRCRSLCDLSLLTKLSSLGSVTTMRPYLYLKQLHNLINTYWINSPTHTSWLMHRHPLRPRFLKLIFRISKSLFFFSASIIFPLCYRSCFSQSSSFAFNSFIPPAKVVLYPDKRVHHFASSVPLLLDNLTSLTSVGRVYRPQPTQGSPLSTLRFADPQGCEKKPEEAEWSLIVWFSARV